MTASAPDVVALRALLCGHRFNESSEDAFQAGVRAVLQAAGVEFQAEVALTPEDRVDFLVGDVGIECKLEGPLSALTRQLHRYAQSPRISALLLATSRLRLTRVPVVLNGKPIVLVWTRGGLL